MQRTEKPFCYAVHTLETLTTEAEHAQRVSTVAEDTVAGERLVVR